MLGVQQSIAAVFKCRAASCTCTGSQLNNLPHAMIYHVRLCKAGVARLLVSKEIWPIVVQYGLQMLQASPDVDVYLPAE